MLPQARIVEETVSPTAGSPGGLAAPTWHSELPHHVADVAQVIGTAGHSLDWDDYSHPMHGHCSSVLLGALWPLAEALDSSGADLLTAFLAGYQADFLTSVALSHAHYRRGWHATSTIGVVGAAGAASRVLELDVSRTATALAIAASSAGGIRANFGTMTKAAHAGFAARDGVRAALLARAGMTASPDWLLGPSSMLECFSGEFGADEALDEVVRHAGQPHGISSEWGLIQKLYPCCGSVHGALDVVIEAVKAADLRPEEIEEVIVHVDPLVLQIMRVERPEDAEGARYSPSWLVAAAVQDRAITPALARPEVHALRERVRIVPDREADNDTRFGGAVDVRARGQVFSAQTPYPSGHPRKPLTAEQLRQKSLSALGTAMHRAAAEEVHEAIAGLEQLPVRSVGERIRAGLRG